MAEYGKRQRRWAAPQLPGLSPAALGVLMAAVLTLLPALLCWGEPLLALEPSGQEPAALTPPEQSSPAPGQSADSTRTVRLLNKEGQVEELTMADYLWGVVAAEMPASFRPEALKAQACAARTYTVDLQARPSEKHPQADVCADSTCCQAYTAPALARARWGLNAGEYSGKLTAAIADTDGLGILCDGAPIQALFFSSAAGRTVDAVEVWGREVSYLKGVDSPEGEEVPNWRTQTTLTPDQVRQAVLPAYPEADLSGPPEGWFTGRTENSAGGVASMSVGGVTLTGGQLRSLFSLRSASFTVTYGGDGFTFETVGYGHGVGMSQYGANALAAQGKDFKEILTWYYTGAQVGALYSVPQSQ